MSCRSLAHNPATDGRTWGRSPLCTACSISQEPHHDLPSPYQESLDLVIEPQTSFSSNLALFAAMMLQMTQGEIVMLQRLAH